MIGAYVTVDCELTGLPMYRAKIIGSQTRKGAIRSQVYYWVKPLAAIPESHFWQDDIPTLDERSTPRLIAKYNLTISKLMSV